MKGAASTCISEDLRGQRSSVDFSLCPDDVIAEGLHHFSEAIRAGNVRRVAQLVAVDQSGAELVQVLPDGSLSARAAPWSAS
jgi:hypothetical protein